MNFHAFSHRRQAAVTAAGAVVSWLVVTPGTRHVGDAVVGDNGDAMWQLSVMRWTLDAFRSLRLPWNPPMYWPATGTYAYSDPMVTQAVLAAPLRAAGASPAFTSNALLVVAFTAALCFAWRLLRRVCGSDAIALAGAATWCFSDLRFGTIVLFQLATAAALVPLVFDVLFATLARPSWRRGLGLGAAVAAATLAALYYAPLLAVTLPAAALTWFAASRRRPDRAHVIAGVVALIVVVLPVAPIALRYQRIHDRDHLARRSEAVFSARPADLTKVTSKHDLLLDVLGLGKPVSGERALFPGFLVVLAVPALVAFGWRRRWPPELVALAAAGAVAYVLSTGKVGVEGIRAPSRFAVAGHLGLVAVACFALAAVPWRRAVVAVATIAVVVPLLDVRSLVPTARVPDETRWSAVDVQLRTMPRGAVAELPVFQSSDGPAWARGEAPRLYLAGIDGNPRVNGYSGFQPPGFDVVASTINTFPSPESVAELRRLRVRYVVVRTDIVGIRNPLDGISERDYLAYFGTANLDRLRVRVAPPAPAGVREVGTYGSAVLYEVAS